MRRKIYKVCIFLIILGFFLIIKPSSALAVKISKTTITLDKTSFTYTGYAIFPDVSVKYRGRELKKGTDYYLRFSDYVDVGKGKVTVIGTGIYEGSVTKVFTINGREMRDLSITLSKTSYTYSGKAIKPDVIIKYNGKTLKKGIDYTISYSDNIKAGTGRVTITGKGNYTGSIFRTFIIRKFISSTNINLKEASYLYLGKTIKVGVTVKDNQKTLKEGKDYVLSYSNNIKAGTAKVTITGQGNYKGSVTKTFIINKYPIESTRIQLKTTKFIYSGNVIKPQVTVKYDNEILKEDVDYDLVYSNNTNVGTGKVTIIGKGNYTGSITKKITIMPDTINKNGFNINIIKQLSFYTYTGQEIKPDVDLSKQSGGKILKLGTDYTVAYSDNINPGTGKVIITGKGNYTGSVTLTFKIIKCEIGYTTIELEKTSYKYTGKEIEPDVTVKYNGKILKEGTDYTISYSDNINKTGSGFNKMAHITITGKGKFYNGSITKTFEIK